MKASRKGRMSSAQPARHAWTYRDLVALPEDQLRHELIDGEHVVTPTALCRPRADTGFADVATLTVAAGDILESPLFPGLRIPVRDVFRGR